MVHVSYNVIADASRASAKNKDRWHNIYSGVYFSQTSTFQLLDKPWSQVSPRHPRGSCLQKYFVHWCSPTVAQSSTSMHITSRRPIWYGLVQVKVKSPKTCNTLARIFGRKKKENSRRSGLGMGRTRAPKCKVYLSKMA